MLAGFSGCGSFIDEKERCVVIDKDGVRCSNRSRFTVGNLRTDDWVCVCRGAPTGGQGLRRRGQRPVEEQMKKLDFNQGWMTDLLIAFCQSFVDSMFGPILFLMACVTVHLLDD